MKSEVSQLLKKKVHSFLKVIEKSQNSELELWFTLPLRWGSRWLYTLQRMFLLENVHDLAVLLLLLWGLLGGGGAWKGVGIYTFDHSEKSSWSKKCWFWKRHGKGTACCVLEFVRTLFVHLVEKSVISIV